MDHHHKRKSDDDSLCAHSSKRARLSMVPDSSASSRLPSPAPTAQSSLITCSHESSVDAPPSQNYYHLHSSALSPPMHVPGDSPPPPPPASSAIPSHLSQEQNPPRVDIFPPINREMLKELDLDVILRHPQLRHDFLFDSGLQFRTMNGGRKQYIADQYWESVLHELEQALDKCKHMKRARPPTPPPWSEKHYSAYLEAATDPQVIDSPIQSQAISSPSLVRRVPALLRTLTQVLSYVIGSVSSERGLSLSQVLSNIDILFIDHELRQGLYEPAGLFTLMGQLLKAHCAPMRDGKVDVMVAVAKGDLNPSGLFGPPFSTSEFLPFTDGQRSIRRTIASLRLCFEILELMKLDIANHHLHYLRPFLIAHGPDFLHRAFIDKVRRGLTSLNHAQRFFNHAYADVMSYPRNELEFPTSTGQAMLSNLHESLARKATGFTRSPLENYPHGFRLHLAFIASLTDMIFNPPTFDSYICQCGLVRPIRDLHSPNVKSSNQHVHEFKRHCSNPTNQLSWPETLWLDSNRIAQLIGDAADLTALYVLLMGWRMLVFAKQDSNGSSGSSASASASSSTIPPFVKSTSFKLEDGMIDSVKKEIWSIAPRKFGSCFFWDDDSSVDDSRRQDAALNDDKQTRHTWKDGMENVALHIAMRAEDTRRDSQPTHASALQFTHRMPSNESISLLRSWLDTHMRRSSPLTTRLRKSLATEVATTAAKMTLHMISAGLVTSSSPYASSEDRSPLDGLSDSTPTATLYNTPLLPELRRGSIPSLLNPNNINPPRVSPSSHHVPLNRPIPIAPSPAAVSAGLEPFMPEIKHLASRIAKLTYINMKIFWSLYTAPGFLDLRREEMASTMSGLVPPTAPLTPETTPQREFAIKVEGD